jgi:putative transposase
LLAALPPKVDLSRFVNELKTTSSRLLRKEFSEKPNRVSRKAGLLAAVLLRHLVRRHTERQQRPHPQPSADAVWLEQRAQDW